MLQKDANGLCGGRKMVLGGLGGGGFLLKTGTLSTSPEGEKNSQMAPTPDKPGGFTPPVVLWDEEALGTWSSGDVVLWGRGASAAHPPQSNEPPR